VADLFWPGDERAGDLASEVAWLAAMARVEQAWLDALARAGIAPGTAELAGLVGPGDLAEVAQAAEEAGNPVPALVALWRTRADGPGAAWVHRGLTSQDVIDTSLTLVLRDVVERVRRELRDQVGSLAALADAHRGTVMAGRTLTQHAVPTTRPRPSRGCPGRPSSAVRPGHCRPLSSWPGCAASRIPSRH
jgi:3-carboxy-cis,cis-muconate cycloisomerase